MGSVPPWEAASLAARTAAAEAPVVAGASVSKSAAPSAATASAETFRPESAGVIALMGKWFSLESARRDLADANKQTDGLAKDLGKIRDAVTQEIRNLARRAASAAPGLTEVLQVPLAKHVHQAFRVGRVRPR